MERWKRGQAKQRWACEEEVWMGEVMTLYLDGWTLMEIPIQAGTSWRWMTVAKRRKSHMMMVVVVDA